MRENGLIPTMEDIHWRTFHHFFSNLRARMKSSSCTEVSSCLLIFVFLGPAAMQPALETYQRAVVCAVPDGC